MKTDLTTAYTRFEDLKISSQFLNFLINNISSCLLMLDKEMKLQAFNDPLKSLFSNTASRLKYQKCGEVIGCAYTVEEGKECGKTSYCNQCELRQTAIESYSTQKAFYNIQFDREFYTTDKHKEERTLKFSIKPMYFENNYYLILILDDITYLKNYQENLIHANQLK